MVPMTPLSSPTILLIVVEQTSAAIAKKNIGVLHYGTSYRDSLLLSTGKLIRKLMTVFIKTKCIQ